MKIIWKLELIEKRKQISQNYQDKALQLHNERWKIAHFIEKELEQELQFLKMEEARLHVQFHEKEGVSRKEWRKLNFYFYQFGSCEATGKKLPPGEVSQIMLAIKVFILKGGSEIPILIFDEIGVGLEEETVKKIGINCRKLDRELK